jgi:hypothetical protein
VLSNVYEQNLNNARIANNTITLGFNMNQGMGQFTNNDNYQRGMQNRVVYALTNGSQDNSSQNNISFDNRNEFINGDDLGNASAIRDNNDNPVQQENSNGFSAGIKSRLNASGQSGNNSAEEKLTGFSSSKKSILYHKTKAGKLKMKKFFYSFKIRVSRCMVKNKKVKIDPAACFVWNHK